MSERSWQEGDYAWAPSAQHDGGAMWTRGLTRWLELPDLIDEQTDQQMTDVGAVLLATVDGPTHRNPATEEPA